MSTAVSMPVSNELQGIGSILGSTEHPKSETAASLRRTLSADMSSKKWLSKNGFSPLKKIASSEEFPVIADEDEPPGGQSDIWSSIVAQKASPVPIASYVHPLAKRERSLSLKSLEICTESLGSETGSDGFSSAPPSETSDEEQEEEQEEEVAEKEVPAAVCVVNCHSSYAIKKSPSRSFPPPLPSLSQSGGVQMRSHRIDGRLVLEAVPVPASSQNYFQAQREGGRLLLTFANPKSNETVKEYAEEVMFQEEEDDDIDNEFEDDDDDDEEDEEEEEEEMEIEMQMERSIVFEMPTKKLPTGVINVHRSALMVNKLMGLTNIDPTWSPKMVDVVGEDQTLAIAQSLPPPPLVTRLIPSSSFNTYDYCWRSKSATPPPPPSTVCTHPLTQTLPPLNKNNKFLLPKNLNPQEQQELGLKADYMSPFVKRCKEARRWVHLHPSQTVLVNY